jgi:pimeloyl-ACP methyl ester carboxylesterase
MQARHADSEGVIEHRGVKIHYEVHGDGAPTILLLPTWTILHKRFWKMQVPYLARHHRVVTYDGPGNGLSDRPLSAAAYDQEAQVAYALAVLDATGTDRAVVVGLSRGANWALELAAHHASRDDHHRPIPRLGAIRRRACPPHGAGWTATHGRAVAGAAGSTGSAVGLDQVQLRVLDGAL